MTKEGWVDAMNITSDIVDVNYININNFNKSISQLYFVFWIIVGNFFIVNLFVGVIIDNFNMIKRENEGIKMLSKEQKTWVEIQKLFLKNIPIKFIKPPDDDSRNLLYRITTYSYFDNFIMACILINTFTMALDQ